MFVLVLVIVVVVLTKESMHSQVRMPNSNITGDIKVFHSTPLLKFLEALKQVASVFVLVLFFSVFYFWPHYSRPFRVYFDFF